MRVLLFDLGKTLLDENDRIRERLSEFKPILRVIA